MHYRSKYERNNEANIYPVDVFRPIRRFRTVRSQECLAGFPNRNEFGAEKRFELAPACLFWLAPTSATIPT